MGRRSEILTPDEARATFFGAFAPRPRGAEPVPLSEALGRVLAADVRAASDLPEFPKSTVDGYAVRAADVADASPAGPAHLRLAGEVLMATAPAFAVGAGEAARIPTGGMLPGGADAVVMQEHAALDGYRAVAVRRSLRPGDNVIQRGEDVRAGDLALPRGRVLRPQDVALLAGLGVTEVEVVLPPRVAVLSTGDEIVPPDHVPRAGQVRDMNTYSLAGLVAQAGGVPQPYGIVEDDFDVLLPALRHAHRTCDLVLVSGGSSVGTRDVVGDAIDALGAPGVLVHGVAIRPGKPTILAVADGVPVVGLPGHPVSAVVVFDQFVRPIVERLLGRLPEPGFRRRVRARLAAAIPPAGGREDHVRVAIEDRAGEMVAVPLLGKSGIITTLTRADGLVTVPLTAHGLPEGVEVEVELFRD